MKDYHWYDIKLTVLFSSNIHSLKQLHYFTVVQCLGRGSLRFLWGLESEKNETGVPHFCGLLHFYHQVFPTLPSLSLYKSFTVFNN